MQLAILAKPAVAFQSLDISKPPARLPLNVHGFLIDALDRPWEMVGQCWSIFVDVVWSGTDHVAATIRDIEMFHRFGLHRGIGITCTYYEGIPDVIQVQVDQMVFAWQSSLNCARIYNHAFRVGDPHIANNESAFPQARAMQTPLPRAWGSLLVMSSVNVLDGFFLYSLLLHTAEHNEVLVLRHDASSHRRRLEDAMARCNAAMEGWGQESYMHACNLCCLIYKNDEGDLVKLQGAVLDGNTIGHLCCAIHNCKVPLSKVGCDIYCPAHLGYEAKCAVTTCESAHGERFLTCPQLNHRSLEVAYREKGVAFFQMHDKIKKRAEGSASDPGSIDGGGLNEVVIVEGDDAGDSVPVILGCDEKSPAGNRRLHAQFSRRRTHNDQLMIRPRGAIISSVTFFGSEAISAVRHFVLATFPTLESMPEVFFYDMNCALLKHCQKIGCHHFNQMAVVVVVFHFQRKHKESDGFCQEHCNPALFPELYVNGRWVFNSSIAEQTNIWFGGFLAIVWEMSAVRFNFFLDEMIKRHNHIMITELACKGHHPWNVPMRALFPAG
ncbi:hypothetical protein K439DRAFT_1649069 [Ramaria rubella]|nr:hypothetical protein K439DRAFT_1649069 [Ramaria rubella]